MIKELYPPAAQNDGSRETYLAAGETIVPGVWAVYRGWVNGPDLVAQVVGTVAKSRRGASSAARKIAARTGEEIRT